MPLSSLRKKVKKSNRNISQFFRDQKRPPVVETGFPTFLVHLIVKNRGRLRRSSEIEVQSGSSCVAESPLEAPSPPSTVLNDAVLERVDSIAAEVRDCGNRKGLLMAVLMVAFLVVLALGAKKFALGLTVSAFVLISVECLRNRGCFRGMIPCSDSMNGLKLTLVKVLWCIGFREAKLEGGNSSWLKEEINSGSYNCQEISLDSEIQSVQIKSLLLGSDEDAKGGDKSGYDGDLKRRKPDSLAALLEEAHDDYTFEMKKKKSGKAQMKSKLKHIFVKKSSKKKKKAGTPDTNPTLTEQDDNNSAEKNLEFGDGNSSSISNGSYQVEEEQDEEEAIETLVSASDSDSSNVVAEESQRKGTCSGYLFLCIIVLIGLYGGRIPALLLILSICFVKKSGGKLRRYAGFCV